MHIYSFWVDFETTRVAKIEADTKEKARAKIDAFNIEDFEAIFHIPVSVLLSVSNIESMEESEVQ